MKLLTELANKYGTDKGTSTNPSHGFSDIYHDNLYNKREGIMRILEIGVDKGGSLRMWRDFTPNATVYGLDVQRHQLISEERIITYYANQSNIQDLDNFIKEHGGNFDLIIDDGGHHTIHQQISLGFLFKYLNSGGTYIVEDLHTSHYVDWMRDWGYDVQYIDSAYNVLKRLEDGEGLSSEHISESDTKYITDTLESIKIFDRDNDKEHITSIITKK